MRFLKHKILILFLLLSFFSVNSCKENKRQAEKAEIAKIVTEWIGKEILLPEDIPCYISGKDTLNILCEELFYKDYKILLYVDSTGCSDCRLKLYEWKQLVEEADSLFQDRVGFLLYFQPKSIREIAFLFEQYRFDYPVFIDSKGIINKTNNFPQTKEYQCFLLDNNNKVLIIGNPVLNVRIWELYKSYISEVQ